MTGRSKALRTALALALQVGFSGAILWLLVSRVTTGDLLSRLATARLEIAWIALALLVLQMLMVARRWQVVCEGLGQPASHYIDSLRWLAISVTLSQVLPSSSGGDAYRLVAYGGRVGLLAATKAAIVDRAAGVVALAAMTCVFSGIGALLAPAPEITIGLLVASILIVAGAFAAGQLVRLKGHQAGAGGLRGLLAEARGLLAPRILAPLLALSLAGHFCSVAAIVVLKFALGLDDVAWWQAGLVLPGAVLATAIPLSIGGWGIREAGMVVGLLAFGVAEGSALALSVAFGMTQLALGAICVPIYLLARTKRQP